MRKAFQYRLYPSKEQAYRLTWILDRARELYNAALQERRDAWQMQRLPLTYAQQCAELPGVKEVRPEYAEVYSQVLQDVLHRLDRTFTAFYRRTKQGQAGYPRFKGRDRYDSFTFPQLGPHGLAVSGADGRLMLPGIGALKVKLHRALEGQPKTLTLKRQGTRWYVLFSCTVEPRPLPLCDATVGLDMGLESFATTSDGLHIPNPRHFREAADALAHAQQRLSRRKRGSHRRRKAARLVARHHERIRERRRDFHHQVARRLVNTHGVIVVEDLRIRNMMQNHHLAKSISDAGWGQFISILQAKAEEAGREVVLVNPNGTSGMCSGCGVQVPKPLSERWHLCPSCGLSIHRDFNAARNILRLGRSLQGVP